MTLTAAESRSALVHRLGRQVRRLPARSYRGLIRAASTGANRGRVRPWESWRTPSGRLAWRRVRRRRRCSRWRCRWRCRGRRGATDDVDDVRRARRGHEVLHGGCALRATGRERSGEVRSATAGGWVKEKTIRAGAFRGVESVAPRLTWGSLAGARPAGERRGCPPRLPPPPTMLVTVDATEVTADATSFSNAPHSSQSCARGVGILRERKSGAGRGGSVEGRWRARGRLESAPAG